MAFQELIGRRTRNGKKFQDNSNSRKFALDLSIGAVHYDGPDWKDIDNTIVPSTANVPELGLADLEMVKDDYEWFALDTLNTIPLILYRNRSVPDSYIAFNPQVLQWTNDLDQVSLVAMPDTSGIAAQVSENRLRWPDAYGAGRDLSYIVGPSRMAKQLTLPAYLGDPPQFIIDGGNPVLELRFIFDLPAGPNAPDIYVDGNLWDKTTRSTTAQAVEFRVGGQSIFWFANPSASDSSEEPETPSVIFVLEKQGPNLEVGVRVPLSWLQNATYPVSIDPTVDLQVDTSADDGFSNDGPGFSSTTFNLVIGLTGGAIYDIFARWIDVTIPRDDTIDVAYITVVGWSSGNDGNQKTNLFFEDSDDAVAPTTQAEHAADVRTTAFTAWDNIDYGVDTPVDSPSIVDVIQEIVDRPSWASGNAMMLLWDDDGSAANDFAQPSAFDGDPTEAPKLHIEYTEATSAEMGTSPGIAIY